MRKPLVNGFDRSNCHRPDQKHDVPDDQSPPSHFKCYPHPDEKTPNFGSRCEFGRARANVAVRRSVHGCPALAPPPVQRVQDKDGSEAKQCDGHERLLTVKLRGRTTTPAGRRGRTLSSSARGAKQEAHHGPLQRLLEAMTRPLATASQGRTTSAQAGAQLTRRQREITSGGDSGSAGALAQFA
jgi:hypothetical protein